VEGEVDDRLFNQSNTITLPYEKKPWREGFQNELVGGTFAFARHRLFSSHRCHRLADYYETEKRIGCGSYGNVFMAVTRQVDAATGWPLSESSTADADRQAAVQCRVRRVAVKAFRLDVKAEDQKRSKRSFETERTMLSHIEHPHIVRMYECFEEKHTLYIVLELCLGGELYERVAKKARNGGRGGIDEASAQSLFRQMLLATSYLHAHKVVHRDIKTENFLLLGLPGSPEGEIIKLCDFGTSVQLTDQNPRSFERVGTLSYTAPEVYAGRGATIDADVWSLGVVLYVLLVGASPFRTSNTDTRQETMLRIQHGDFETSRDAWTQLPPLAREMVCLHLVIEEHKRLSCGNALWHPWMQPVHPPKRDGDPLTAVEDPQKPETRANDTSFQSYSYCAPLLFNLILRFTHLDAMQQMLLVVCALMVSESELLALKEPIPWYDLFFALDANEDGKLSLDELAHGLSIMLGERSTLSPEQLRHLLEALDLNCSGAIEWVEWVAVALVGLDAGAFEDAEPLSTAFRLLDRFSADGSISVTDLLPFIGELGSRENSQSAENVVNPDRVIEMLNRWSVMPLHNSASTSLSLADMRRIICSVNNSNDTYVLPRPAPTFLKMNEWLGPPWCNNMSDTLCRYTIGEQEQKGEYGIVPVCADSRYYPSNNDLPGWERASSLASSAPPPLWDM